MNQTNLPIHGMGCSCSKCSDPRGTPIQRHRRFLIIMALWCSFIVAGVVLLLQGASAL